ncbi:MAG TPA: shikimate dehydrogenase [Rhodanobacteraceae bacterium]
MSTSLFAVFGHPIAHSLSPRIHAMFGAQFGIAIEYRRIQADRAEFADRLDAFARDGGRAANVTLPLKQDAATHCIEVSDRARRCGSVNTLTRTLYGWRGDSTDGVGFLRDLRERHAFDPRGRSALLLGAGGAARAVAFALAGEGVARLSIANRTHARAEELAEAIGARHVDAVAWDVLGSSRTFDLIVHATAAGHESATFASAHAPVAPQTLCYDLSYGHAAAAFLFWARAAGALRAVDGLGMLVEQAAESFTIWHGRRPNTAPVHAGLRREMRPSLIGA